MPDKAFRFKTGRFECLVVSDDTLSDAPGEPGEVPAREPQVHYLNCLFINSGEHRILVDTGCGDGFQATAGKLVGNLAAAGIKCSDIDRIIITHGHLDHVGGAFDAEGRPVFPNARFITSEKEWECWVNPAEKTELQHMFFAAARRHLLSRRQQFDLVQDNTEVFPGIRLIAAPGHTPGLMMLEMASGGERLLCVGDIIHSRLELAQADYYALFDVAPQLAAHTRSRALSQAARSRTLIFACHFPFPGLGHMVQKGGDLAWQPLAENELA
jgi:glyoxylase-like metal-dependent hydrolase (beta-lactamase superfamily II)